MKINKYIYLLISIASPILLLHAQNNYSTAVNKSSNNVETFEDILNSLNTADKISNEKFAVLLKNIPPLPEHRSLENYEELAKQIQSQSTSFNNIVGLWAKYSSLQNAQTTALLLSELNSWITRVEVLKISKADLPRSTLNVPPPPGVPGVAGQDYHTATNTLQRIAWGEAVKQNQINERIIEQTFVIENSLKDVRFRIKFIQDVIKEANRVEAMNN